jgi:hypothetical protein
MGYRNCIVEAADARGGHWDRDRGGPVWSGRHGGTAQREITNKSHAHYASPPTPMALRIVPAQASKSASVKDTAGTFGLHDTLQYGPRTIAAEVKSQGSLKDRLENVCQTRVLSFRVLICLSGLSVGRGSGQSEAQSATQRSRNPSADAYINGTQTRDNGEHEHLIYWEAIINGS